MTLGLLLPAAGTSSRMRGRDKLLERIEGIPLLLRQLRVALSLGSPVLVTLPKDDVTRSELLVTENSSLLEKRHLANAHLGLCASLNAGAAWATQNDFDALMIVLPDMPDLDVNDLQRVRKHHEAHPAEVIRATNEAGQYGHPTVVPARIFPALATLSGDHGARDLFSEESILPCPLPGRHATTDLDTPEAWDAWRAKRD